MAPVLVRSRPIPRRCRSPRVRRGDLEHLEERQLLSYADFELSSLLPASGGDGSRRASSRPGSSIKEGWGAQAAYQPIGDVNGDTIDDMLLSAPAPGSTARPILTVRST